MKTRLEPRIVAARIHGWEARLRSDMRRTHSGCGQALRRAENTNRSEALMNRNERNLEIVRQTAEILSTGSGLSETFERFCLMLAKFIEASVVFIAIKRQDGVFIDFAYDHGNAVHNPQGGRKVSSDSQTQ